MLLERAAEDPSVTQHSRRAADHFEVLHLHSARVAHSSPRSWPTSERTFLFFSMAPLDADQTAQRVSGRTGQREGAKDEEGAG